MLPEFRAYVEEMSAGMCIAMEVIIRLSSLTHTHYLFRPLLSQFLVPLSFCISLCRIGYMQVRAENAVEVFCQFAGPHEVEIAQHIRPKTLRAR